MVYQFTIGERPTFCRLFHNSKEVLIGFGSKIHTMEISLIADNYFLPPDVEIRTICMARVQDSIFSLALCEDSSVFIQDATSQVLTSTLYPPPTG